MFFGQIKCGFLGKIRGVFVGKNAGYFWIKSMGFWANFVAFLWVKTRGILGRKSMLFLRVNSRRFGSGNAGYLG